MGRLCNHKEGLGAEFPFFILCLITYFRVMDQPTEIHGDIKVCAFLECTIYRWYILLINGDTYLKSF